MLSERERSEQYQGAVFNYGLLILRARKNADISTTRWEAAVRADATFRNGWKDFRLASWSWLWTVRNQEIFRVTVFGITLFRRSWGDLKDLWSVPFGPCPFNWTDGPENV